MAKWLRLSCSTLSACRAVSAREEDADDELGRNLEQGDHRPEQAVGHDHQPPSPERDAHRISKGEGLGHQLSHHHAEAGDRQDDQRDGKELGQAFAHADRVGEERFERIAITLPLITSLCDAPHYAKGG
jgi:hypothetical protein